MTLLFNLLSYMQNATCDVKLSSQHPEHTKPTWKWQHHAVGMCSINKDEINLIENNGRR